eukprot:gene3275-3785_t
MALQQTPAGPQDGPSTPPTLSAPSPESPTHASSGSSTSFGGLSGIRSLDMPDLEHVSHPAVQQAPMYKKPVEIPDGRTAECSKDPFT